MVGFGPDMLNLSIACPSVFFIAKRGGIPCGYLPLGGFLLEKTSAVTRTQTLS